MTQLWSQNPWSSPSELVSSSSTPSLNIKIQDWTVNERSHALNFCIITMVVIPPVPRCTHTSIAQPTSYNARVLRAVCLSPPCSKPTSTSTSTYHLPAPSISTPLHYYGIVRLRWLRSSIHKHKTRVVTRSSQSESSQHVVIQQEGDLETLDPSYTRPPAPIFRYPWILYIVTDGNFTCMGIGSCSYTHCLQLTMMERRVIIFLLLRIRI